MKASTTGQSAGLRFREALRAEKPLQVVGAITPTTLCWQPKQVSGQSTFRVVASLPGRWVSRTWESQPWKMCSLTHNGSQM
jgi:hypothetical protein